MKCDKCKYKREWERQNPCGEIVFTKDGPRLKSVVDRWKKEKGTGKKMRVMRYNNGLNHDGLPSMQSGRILGRTLYLNCRLAG